MALGVGLTLTNSWAVVQALFGYKTPFARTPKYRVKKKGEGAATGAEVVEALSQWYVERGDHEYESGNL